MDKKTLTGAFPVQRPDADTQMMGIVADISAIHETMRSTDRRLVGIEDAVKSNSDLLRAVTVLQSQTNQNSGDIQELRARCETVDKNVDAIGTHDFRLATLERNIIENGSSRMRAVEDSIKERSTQRRALIIYGLVTMVGCIGWVLAHYVLPVLMHLPISG